ncbi:prephenate dehydrogenase dimerization domain-containing protein [Achromobacter xylosoxidans]
MVLTPLPENAAADVARVRAAWQACGATVVDMEAQAHDRVFASVSHLPHLLSAVYMERQVATPTVAGWTWRAAVFGISRGAVGSPEMWRDIFLSNRDAMLTELAEVRAVLDRAERAIADGDGAGLQALLETAAQARRDWRKE